MGDERTIGGPIPRGVEVLINKAAVDADFKEKLLSDRRAAVDAIKLELEPSEEYLLGAIPNAQLEMIIDKTVVPPEHRSAFLSMTAKVMLVAIAAMAMSSCYVPATKGINPGKPRPASEQKTEEPKTGGTPPEPEKPEQIPVTDGIRPDRPLSRGHRIDRPPPKPQPEETAPETEVVPEKPQRLPAKGGSRPDRPPSLPAEETDK